MASAKAKDIRLFLAAFAAFAISSRLLSACVYTNTARTFQHQKKKIKVGFLNRERLFTPHLDLPDILLIAPSSVIKVVNT
jgi:hypothetical protein